MRLVIVESGKKAKTITPILKKLNDGHEYIVRASVGHIRDLTTKSDENMKYGININDNFKPTYEISSDRKSVIYDLRKLAAKASDVIMATDDDDEGEAIAYHLCDVLNLDINTTKRIIFHSITPDAILESINNSKTISMPTVYAQQARRVIDRLIGFDLSELLRKSLGNKFCTAGRVQSVVVLLVLIREREIRDFERESYYNVNGIFSPSQPAKLNTKFNEEDELNTFMEHCLSCTFTLGEKDKSIRNVAPPPPYMTITLQQDAGKRFGMSSAKIMGHAQKLYEMGFITYHRTDSLNLSSTALTQLKTYIIDNYGPNYHKLRNKKTKDKSAQEAHEAIRPTLIDRIDIDGKDIEPGDKLIYSMIWKRAVASQMSDCEIEVQKWMIDISDRKEKFVCTCEKVLFDGYRKVYGLDIEDDDNSNESTDIVMPDWEIGQEIEFEKIMGAEKLTSPDSRFTETSLLGKMKQLGIGRPSTYADIMSKVLSKKRDYVVINSKPGEKVKCKQWTLSADTMEIDEKELITEWMAEKKKLFITETGETVINYLTNNFDTIMNNEFTKHIHDKIDNIKDKKELWYDVVRVVYDNYNPKYEELIASSKYSGKEVQKRNIGTYKGQPVYTYMGKYGHVIQIGEFDDKMKRYIPVPNGMKWQTVEMKDVENLLGFPLYIGKYEEVDVYMKKGPYGLYFERKMDNKPIRTKFMESHEKYKTPELVNIEDVIAIFETKTDESDSKAPTLLKTLKGKGRTADIDIIDGKYGPYFKMKDKFIPLKGHDLDKLTHDKCKIIFEENQKYKKSAKKRESNEKKKTKNDKSTETRHTTPVSEPVKKPKIKKKSKKNGIQF